VDSGGSDQSRPPTTASAGHSPQAPGWLPRPREVLRRQPPTFAAEGEPPYKGTILTVGERGPAQNITVEDCFVHDGLDAKNWGTKMWMNRHNGMYQGRHGTKLTFRNNFVLNTRFGIELASTESLCQGNVISDFSGDGIRVMRDGITVEHNVIRNVYVGSGDGNQNRGFDGRSAATGDGTCEA
jgi:hypothetical protein